MIIIIVIEGTEKGNVVTECFERGNVATGVERVYIVTEQADIRDVLKGVQGASRQSEIQASDRQNDIQEGER